MQQLLPGTGDGLRGCRADAEAPCYEQVVGGVDVAAKTRPRAGQFDSARMAMALRRIWTEPRIERDAEGDQCRCARAVPVPNETAGMTSGSGDCLTQFLWLQCG